MKYVAFILLFLTIIGCSNSQKETTQKTAITRAMDTTFVSEESTRVEYFRIHSPSMKRDIKVAVVLPPEYGAHPDKKYPVLYTLHGHGAPWDTWAKMVKLRRELEGKPFIYTCFDGDVGSNYIDSYYPLRTARKTDGGEQDTVKRTSLFMTFFFGEFVPGIDSWYRIDAAKRAVTGFSMGGGGAMTYMLQNPGMFCSVSGLSTGYLDFGDSTTQTRKWSARHLGPYEEFKERYDAIDHCLLIKKHLQAGVTLPPIYQHIGTEDFLLEPNRKMAAFAKELGLDFSYRETAGGHNWKFWHPASVGVAEFHWKYFNQ